MSTAFLAWTGAVIALPLSAFMTRPTASGTHHLVSYLKCNFSQFGFTRRGAVGEGHIVHV